MLLILAGAWVALEVLVIAGQELGIPCLGPVFLVFLNLLGQSLLGLGLLITVPVSALVVTSVYRQLGAQLWIPSPSLRGSAHGRAGRLQLAMPRPCVMSTPAGRINLYAELLRGGYRDQEEHCLFPGREL